MAHDAAVHKSLPLAFGFRESAAALPPFATE